MQLFKLRKQYHDLMIEAFKLNIPSREFKWYVLKEAQKLFPLRYSWAEACLKVAKERIEIEKKKKENSNV
jgi:hypothetical protein